MKNFKTLISLLSLIGITAISCGNSPESLADEMCDCIKDKDVITCTNLYAQEHTEKLADDPEGRVVYANKVASCK